MLCASMTIYAKHIFLEDSNKPIKCSCILVFLKQSACYTVNPDIHQWYMINTNKITDNHKIAICNDTTINMVPLPPAEPSEFNTFERIVRLSLPQNQRDLPNSTQTQAIPYTSIITDDNIGNTPKNNMIQSHNQSTIILQQFSMITKELINFTNKVSEDITKTQAYNTGQENTSKLIENAIPQALTKAQSTTTTQVVTRNFRTNYANPLFETNCKSAWWTSIHVMLQQLEIDTHPNSQTLWNIFTLTNYTNQHTPVSPLLTSINQSSNILGFKPN